MERSEKLFTSIIVEADSVIKCKEDQKKIDNTMLYFKKIIQFCLVIAENYSEVIKLSREFEKIEHQQYIDKFLAEVKEINQIEIRLKF